MFLTLGLMSVSIHILMMSCLGLRIQVAMAVIRLLLASSTLPAPFRFPAPLRFSHCAACFR